MLLKKILLTSAGMIAPCTLIPCANADTLDTLISKVPNASLYVTNNTDKPSSVRILTSPFSPPFCAAKSTPAHSSSETDSSLVSLLCGYASPCKAELYNSTDCAKSGEHIADVSIDLSTLAITATDLTDQYHVRVEGSSVTISQK